MQNLPSGIQTFSDIRQNDYLYIDKTDYIYDLTHTGKVYFLSRPRRFGKSLLISTLDSYFSGKKELFERLKIAKLEKEWKQYTVLRIDFGGDDYSLEKNLHSKFELILSDFEEMYNISRNSDLSYSGRFHKIINAVSKAYNTQVVVLIDEYDKPILDAMYMPHEEHNRAELRAFYSVLKSNDENLKFIFLTGITRVPHVNIFSGLNQIDDISMSEKYAAICGITKDYDKNTKLYTLGIPNQEVRDGFYESLLPSVSPIKNSDLGMTVEPN